MMMVLPWFLFLLCKFTGMLRSLISRLFTGKVALQTSVYEECISTQVQGSIILPKVNQCKSLKIVLKLEIFHKYFLTFTDQCNFIASFGGRRNHIIFCSGQYSRFNMRIPFCHLLGRRNCKILFGETSSRNCSNLSQASGFA